MSKLLLAVVALICAASCFQQATAAIPWSVSQATQCVYYSYAAYCNTKQIASWTCPQCRDRNFRFVASAYSAATDTYGFVGYSGNTIYVVFRGTHDLENWITDFKFGKLAPYKNLPNITVHEGFLQAYTNIMSQVHSGYQAAVSKCPHCTQLIVTGHSLGAALSTLGAIDLFDSGLAKLPITVFNFGSPRVGNTGFVAYYHRNIPMWRVVNEADIVPHLPFEWMGFTHSSTEVWEHTTQYKLCSSTNGEDPTCSDSITLPFNTADHTKYMTIQGTC